MAGSSKKRAKSVEGQAPSSPAKKVLKSPRINRPVGWSSQAWSVSGPGRMIFTSGLTSRDGTGAVVHLGDIRGQTRQVLENLSLILAEDNATLADVIKVTIYLRNLSEFDAFQEVRNAYFPQNPPAATMVTISSLADERLLVEIEAVAFVSK
jgi:2-iminobutanoate/2-iminopropanoate deaminase